MVQAEIVEWIVAVGYEVSLDQPICSIETDKSVVEMTTPYAGTVLALGGEVGATIEVGQPLIVVGVLGESALAGPASQAPSIAVAEEASLASGAGARGQVRSPLLRRLADGLGVATGEIMGSGHGGEITRSDIEVAARANAASVPPVARIHDSLPGGSGSVLAMPKVRRVARERGIDLHSLAGSGPGGVVVLDDLHQVAAPDPASGGQRRERLSPLRRSIGRHLTESATTIPQFTSMVDVDATALLETRAALKGRSGRPMPLDALVMYLLVPVLREHPRMNARLDADAGELVIFDRFDIGVAVDTPDGLIVPVVRHADQRSVDEVAAEIQRLALAARERTVHPEELAGATCTLNNVGAVGLEQGTPILPVGTTAIIAPGRSRPTVYLRDGNSVEVPVITLSATFDHRVVDGGDAGRFLTQLRDHLEVPALGLL